MKYQILLTAVFSGSIDSWTQHLCLCILDGKVVELSNRVAEPLMYCGDSLAGEVIWPEGYDPDEDDGDTLPISIGGKKVEGRDGDFIVGEDLVSHDDDEGTFSYGEFDKVLEWLKKHDWESRPNKQEFDVAKDTIRAALKSIR